MSLAREGLTLLIPRTSLPHRKRVDTREKRAPGCADHGHLLLAVTTEIELKLAVTPRALEQLAKVAAVHAVGVPSNAHLYTQYYDTASRALWRRRLTLRVRRDANGWTQTVKGGGNVEAGVHRRIESETAVAGPTPDLGRIADPVLASTVRRAMGHTTPAPVFHTEFTRYAYRVHPAPGSTVLMCFDHGSIRAGNRHKRICEIELELEQGPVWRLYDLARELSQTVRVRVEHRSKAERGYALAGGAPAHPVKAEASPVRDSMRSFAAFQALSFACLAHLDANRAGMLANDDPEYLHQMRVALRRLRAVFSVFSAVLPKPATAAPLVEIRWLGHALGPARDWDVFVAQRLLPVATRHPEHRGLVALQRACERAHAAAQRRARRAVRSRRYQSLLLDLGSWLAGESWASLLPLNTAHALQRPVRNFAEAAFVRRLRQVRRRGQHLARLDTARLHRLRIAVKKLRYCETFFAPLFPACCHPALRTALAALQDALGGINDSMIAVRLLEQTTGPTRSTVLQEACKLVMRSNQAALVVHRRKLQNAWKALRVASACWE